MERRSWAEVAEMANILVQRALAMMERELGSISVDDICTRLDISRSWLHEEFVRHTGRGPRDVLRRRRLRRACELLDANPEASLDDVAVAVGYSSANTLVRAFGDVWGISPRLLEAMAHENGRRLLSLVPTDDE